MLAGLSGIAGGEKLQIGEVRPILAALRRELAALQAELDSLRIQPANQPGKDEQVVYQ